MDAMNRWLWHFSCGSSCVTHIPVRRPQVFCELERALTNELDFLAEAQAMEKVR